MGTLQGLYYQKMVGISSSNFSDRVTIGERIVNGLKTRKVASIDSQTVAKKSRGFAKKKEAKANAVITNVYPQVQAHMVLCYTTLIHTLQLLNISNLHTNRSINNLHKL